MIEQEVKVLEINLPSTIKRLRNAGAKFISEDNIIANIFVILGCAFRVRRIGSKIYIAFKKRLDTNLKVKKVIEIEFRFYFYNLIVNIFRVFSSKESMIAKRRIKYSMNDATFDIDKIRGIPYYMEIEARPEIISKYLELLNIPHQKVKTWGTDKLLAYYRTKKSSRNSVKSITFPKI